MQSAKESFYHLESETIIYQNNACVYLPCLVIGHVVKNNLRLYSIQCTLRTLYNE